jgi:hypothetical protein
LGIWLNLVLYLEDFANPIMGLFNPKLLVAHQRYVLEKIADLCIQLTMSRLKNNIYMPNKTS